MNRFSGWFVVGDRSQRFWSCWDFGCSGDDHHSGWLHDCSARTGPILLVSPSLHLFQFLEFCLLPDLIDDGLATTFVHQQVASQECLAVFGVAGWMGLGCSGCILLVQQKLAVSSNICCIIHLYSGWCRFLWNLYRYFSTSVRYDVVFTPGTQFCGVANDAYER